MEGIRFLTRDEALERFSGFLELQKTLSLKHTKKTYRMYLGDSVEAKVEYELRGFDIWTVYHDRADIGSFGVKVISEDDVKNLQGLINDFNIRVCFNNKNGKEENIKYTQFAIANGLMDQPFSQGNSTKLT